MDNPFDFFKKDKSPTVSAKIIITEGFNLPHEKGFTIMRYINQLLSDYPNNPSGALKEIPLNLKKNERHLAAFILGNQYAPIFKDMKDEEMTEFLATIADEIDIGLDRMEPVLSYIIGDMTINLKGEPPQKVIKNILNTNFSEKDKDYILFSYGLISRLS